MKFSLLSLKAFDEKVLKSATTGSRTEKGLYPKMAAVALLTWLEKNGYSQDDYDFYDLDMLLPNDEKIRTYFLQYQPTVIGLSSILASNYGEVKRVSRIARQACPNAWIIVGGHLVAAANTVLRLTDVDICIAGDGERPLLEFLEYVKHNNRKWDYQALLEIKGVCLIDQSDEFRFAGWPKGIPADELENPDYEMLSRGLKDQPQLVENYFKDTLIIGENDPLYNARKDVIKVASVTTAKGCVAKCSFCQRATHGYRVIPISKIEKHIIELKNSYGITVIEVLDENFGSNVKHAYAFAELMKKHDLLWEAGGVRVTTFSADDIKFMKAHNCLGLRFGIESGSDSVLGVMGKNIVKKQTTDAFQKCIDADMYTEMSIWMVGNPGDDNTTVLETGFTIGVLAHKLGIPPSISAGTIVYVMPVPGTPVYEYAQKIGVLPTDPDGEEKYLFHLATMRTASKANYCNINGASKKEWHFWDVLPLLEASRTYRKLCRDTPPKASFTGQSVLLKNSPEPQPFWMRLRISLASLSWAIGNPVVDALPRAFIYTLLMNVNYFYNVLLKNFVRFILGRVDTRAFPGNAESRMTIEVTDQKNSRVVTLRRHNKQKFGNISEASNPEHLNLTRGQ